jgi:CubicO group peptidase (beta-lactamase class C family)
MLRRFLFALLITSRPLFADTVVDPVVARVMAARHVPAVVVVIVEGDRVTFVKGYGGVNPATTLFRVGSVTKVFTAAAIMELLEQGSVRDDVDVNRYLSGFRIPAAFGAPVTIAELLTHTAGFDEKLARTATRDPKSVMPPALFLARELPPRVFPPGRTIQYSNHGYVVLGAVIENVTHTSLAAVFRDRIFEPLGMTRTVYGLPPGVRGYDRHGEVAQAHLQIGAAADITSTADDMAKFMIALLNGGGAILQPATLARMQQRHFSEHPDLPGVAYGLWESRYNNVRGLYHLGGVRGFGSMLYLLPDQRTGIFIANNGDDNSLGFEVVDAFLASRYPGQGAAPMQPRGPLRTIGAYRFFRHARTTIEKLGLLAHPEVTAEIDAAGRLTIADLLVRPTGMHYEQEGSFERAGILVGGRLIAIDTDVLERVPWYARSALHEFLLVAFIVLFVSAFIEKQRPLTLTSQGATRQSQPRIVKIISALNLIFIAGLAAVMFSVGRSDIWFGYPKALYVVLAIPIVSAIATLWLLAVAIRDRCPRTTLHAVGQLGFLFFLAYWRLLGYWL